jgi:hypothetical protein
LVNLFELYDDARTCQRQIDTYISHPYMMGHLHFSLSRNIPECSACALHLQATRRNTRTSQKMSAGATFLGLLPSCFSRSLNSWLYSEKHWMSKCLKYVFPRFTQHTLSLLRILATDVQPITVDVYGRSRYRSCSTVMSASSISLWREFVPHRKHRLNNKERLRAGGWSHEGTQVYVQPVCYFFFFLHQTRRHADVTY